MWNAFLWGGLSSSALYLGEALARPMQHSMRATGLITAFGAGTLLSAIAYELIPETNLRLNVGVAFFIGALTYYFCDRLIDHHGGEDRQKIAGADEESSGAAMFLGALLDGIPESFILGLSLAIGGGLGIAFVAAVFISNVPQGVAGTISLRTAGYSDRHIFLMWTGLTISCAVIAAIGYRFAGSFGNQGLNAQAFAAGAVLTMLADSMMPEAFRHGGRAAGIVTVAGYGLAAALTILQ